MELEIQGETLQDIQPHHSPLIGGLEVLRFSLSSTASFLGCQLYAKLLMKRF
jgi:hypothetical protein